MTQPAFSITSAASAAHKRVTVLIYGESGIGKTSLVKTLGVTDDTKVFYVAADPGQLVFRGRNFQVAEAPNGDWNEKVMDDVYRYLQKEAASYEWIVVDGLDELGAAVLRSKLLTQRDARRAYGEMGDYMSVWAKHMRDLKGTSILFITHIDNQQDETGAMYFHPSFPGKAVTSQLNDWFDLVGCMRSVRTDKEIKRLIQFRPEADPRFKVKDRSSVMTDYEEPNLGAIFNRIHEAGFELSEPAGPPQSEEPEKRSKEDLTELALVASECGVNRSSIVEYAQATWETKPGLLSIDDFQALLTWVRSQKKQ